MPGYLRKQATRLDSTAGFPAGVPRHMRNNRTHDLRSARLFVAHCAACLSTGHMRYTVASNTRTGQQTGGMMNVIKAIAGSAFIQILLTVILYSIYAVLLGLSFAPSVYLEIGRAHV